MKTIKEQVIKTSVINKSKFITVLKRVNSITEINDSLIDLKEEFPGATHYCYAYIFNDCKKASDDKEPNKTAGLPILNVLEKEELNQVLCVVIRYYGGVKLGTGGLVRAYTKSVKSALEEASIDQLINGVEITITFTYDNIKNIDYIIRNAKIINQSFDEEVTYIVNISFDELNLIKDQLLMFTNTVHQKENVFI